MSIYVEPSDLFSLVSCINILKFSPFPYYSPFIQMCCKDINTRTPLFIVSPFCSTHRPYSKPGKMFGCCVVFIIKCIIMLCSIGFAHKFRHTIAEKITTRYFISLVIFLCYPLIFNRILKLPISNSILYGSNSNIFFSSSKKESFYCCSMVVGSDSFSVSDCSLALFKKLMGF